MRQHWAVSAAFLFVCVSSICVNAQVRYATGQNVAPVFEGWEHNPDGTYSMVFGYLNRNYEEEVDIPVGPDNKIALGDGAGGDRGQPEHFYPRRQRFLFKVVVPANWDKTQKVVWALTSRGRTDQAKGWLQPEWELSEDVVIENMGGGVPDPANKPPSHHESRSNDRPAEYSDADRIGYRRRASEAVPPGAVEPGSRLGASPAAGRSDQMDSVPGPWQSHLRSGCQSGSIRSTGGADIEGEFRRTRQLCSSRHRVRWAVILDPRRGSDRQSGRRGRGKTLTARFLSVCSA